MHPPAIISAYLYICLSIVHIYLLEDTNLLKLQHSSREGTSILSLTLFFCNRRYLATLNCNSVYLKVHLHEIFDIRFFSSKASSWSPDKDPKLFLNTNLN
jgi:hypothetical protein